MNSSICEQRFVMQRLAKKKIKKIKKNKKN